MKAESVPILTTPLNNHEEQLTPRECFPSQEMAITLMMVDYKFAA
ncbi:MAG TPA: hypothetical protein VN207_00895 [Ktedonobacteraceae bacterium]|nr:hypothetical protein [Ktedonobacteraceae bacterium]